MPTIATRRKTGTVRPMAQTIRDVVELRAPDVVRIMDLAQPMTREFVMDVVHRGLFGYRHRSPVALCNSHGDFVGNGTDFDLLSMLFALAERGAVVHIDEYRRIHPKKVTPGVRRVRDGLRFGHIVGLVSNARSFAFSLRIKDLGVIEKDRAGAERAGADRAYAFTTPDGLPNGQGGVIRVRFVPDQEENLWLVRLGVIHDGEALSFDGRNIVHLNRRQAFGAAPYLVMKLLLERLWVDLVYAMQSGSRRGKSIVEAQPAIFEAVLEHPDFLGLRIAALADPFKLSAYVDELPKLIQFVQFVTRADELAYWLYGYKTQYLNQWLGGTTWRNWTQSGVTKSWRSILSWRRLELGNGFALRVRETTK